MGYMDNGRWFKGDNMPATADFVRKPSTFRHVIGADLPLEPEAGRYYLFAALSCPWASRTHIVHSLKKLAGVIPLVMVHMDSERGWSLPSDGTPSASLGELRHLHEFYHLANPQYSGRVTVPVLWDSKTRTIVNNESSEIIVMLNQAFDAWGDATIDLYPKYLRPEIDRINELVYEGLNNAVYRAGFSMDQTVYEKAVIKVFETLDYLEDLLASRRYLTGDHLTLADIRLFTTGIRFDLVYFGHFKCNLRQWQSYPNLWGWLRELYQMKHINETLDLSAMKRGYYSAHKLIDPTGIVPLGPNLNYLAPHSRDRTYPA
jgi:putative glutathione S-transferase